MSIVADVRCDSVTVDRIAKTGTGDGSPESSNGIDEPTHDRLYGPREIQLESKGGEEVMLRFRRLPSISSREIR